MSKKLLTLLFPACALAFTPALLTGCEDDEVEEVGDDIEDDMEDAGDKVKEGVDDVEDEVDDLDD